MPDSLEASRVNSAWPTIAEAARKGLDEEPHLDKVIPVIAEMTDELHLDVETDSTNLTATVGGPSVCRTFRATVATREIEHRFGLSLAQLDELPVEDINRWAAGARSLERREILRELAERATPEKEHAELRLDVAGVDAALQALVGFGELRLVVFGGVDISFLTAEQRWQIAVVQVDGSNPPMTSSANGVQVAALAFRTGSGPKVVRARDLELAWTTCTSDGVQLVLTERVRVDWSRGTSVPCVRFVHSS